MKILLLGATGRTGKLALDAILQNGYEVNCLVRDIDKIEKNRRINLFKGTPTNIKDLEKAILGCECVISIVNISRTSDFPWARLRTPKKFISNTIKNVIALAKEHKIKRVIVCSAWGVAETEKDIPFWFRALIKFSNIGIAYKDHKKQEELLAKSNLDWTIVRPAGLTNSKRSQKVRESIENKPKPSLTISRLAVANYIVNTIYNDKLIQNKVVISKD